MAAARAKRSTKATGKATGGSMGGSTGGPSRAGPAGEAGPARELATLPPWLVAQGARLRAREAAGRLPHALLVRGPQGMGKRPFARWFAEAILCHAPTVAGACGACPSCAQLLAGAHPDFRALEPDGSGIRIDAVRELLGWMQLSAPGGRWRIALLEGADTLNRNAANALLKTLEEPGERALLLLVADRPGTLPATVRSRCQDVVLRLEDRAAALRWLEGRIEDPETLLARAADAPFAALELATPARAAADAAMMKAWRDLFLHRASVGRIVESLAGLPARTVLATFSRYAALALRARGGLEPGTDAAETAVTVEVAGRLDDAQWFTLRDHLQRLYRIDGPSFKSQAVLEGLFADTRLMLTAEDV